MKHSFKKLFSILAAFMMVIGLGLTTVKAASETYSITVNNAVEGATYTAYKLFDATYDGEKVAYTATNAQKDGLPGNVANLFTFTATSTDGVWNVTTNAKPNAITAAIRTAIKDGSYNPTAAGSVTAVKAEGSETVTAVIPLTEPGYYYVSSTVGTLIGVTTAKPNATINEKNSDKPVIDKKADDAESGTAEVGKTVNYTIDITVQPGAARYVVTDVLENLDFVAGSFKVNDSDSYSTIGSFTAPTADNSNTMTFTFNQDYLDGISVATKVTLSYQATVNESAVTVDKATNTATLTYGTNNNTTSDKVELKNYGFDLVKTDGSDKVLTGAEFQIKNGDTVISWVLDNGYYRPAKAGEKNAVTEIEAGNVKFNGLANGTYIIHETKAPDGYAIATKDATVTLNNSDNWATVTADTYTEGGVKVVNVAGSSLPSTGGMGTTLLYTVGGLLVVGAGVAFITKKRMEA